MKPDDFHALMDRIKFDAPTLASCLAISHNQCRKYLCGQTAIPKDVEERALQLEAEEKRLDETRLAKYEADLAKQPGFGLKVILLPEPICRN